MLQNLPVFGLRYRARVFCPQILPESFNPAGLAMLAAGARMMARAAGVNQLLMATAKMMDDQRCMTRPDYREAGMKANVIDQCPCTAGNGVKKLRAFASWRFKTRVHPAFARLRRGKPW
jgi:hypothetical protein